MQLEVSKILDENICDVYDHINLSSTHPLFKIDLTIVGNPQGVIANRFQVFNFGMFISV